MMPPPIMTTLADAGISLLGADGDEWKLRLRRRPPTQAKHDDVGMAAAMDTDGGAE